MLHTRLLVQAAVCVGMISFLGCGANDKGAVSGKVLFKGEVLPSGTVAFQGTKGWVGSSNIRSGLYEIKDVPIGEVKISVQTFAPSPGVVPPNTPASAVQLPSLKFVEIPAVYSDMQTTPLRFTVQPGTQLHDVEVAEAK